MTCVAVAVWTVPACDAARGEVGRGGEGGQAAPGGGPAGGSAGWAFGLLIATAADCVGAVEILPDADGGAT